ncbi:cation:proton antiporter [Roseococcus sp. SDR]|uniref:cation:proton antiporter domain-containing protein n=1 Tax=Roseococcus sp. SDR TaxID=2835532 RepID=UPI001BCEB1C9|nr:cation:proton antiporter [Roseococcus sp. SDR]MBS7791164.1 cation:proton antiporter [Roseococcus sp. SDR]MBV1846478.1 cation:proton antiporter [Roseococcus sp. SDR]
MPHETGLIATIALGLTFALFLGLAARAVRLPTIVGYLAAGIVIGPATPGFVADLDAAQQLAEIGVILLMFGVGLHFSPRELADARGVAVPGALLQMGCATLLGWGLARLLGWGDAAGIIFGFCLSVASTVVLLRALTERGELATTQGHTAVGWLVVEDMAMVVALVLVPVLAAVTQDRPAAGLMIGLGGAEGVALMLLITLGKVAIFVALMLVVGARVLPWALSWVGRLRSRELFSLAALVTALGIAYLAYVLFGVSFALGAFLAGLVLGQSALSQKAAEQTLPLRDAFAVLFFVAVGMLFDPGIVLRQPLALIGTVLVVLIGKTVAAYAIARLRGLETKAALSIAAALAQVGEFSFILAGLAVTEGVLPEAGRDLILAAAIISIAVNPFMFRLADWVGRRAPTSPPA